ncbi:MAG: hypothetical protein ACRDGA_07130 [Bacteroidota bacterium]
MNCLTVRKILLAAESPDSIGSSEHLHAKQHVADCRECQLFFAQEEQLRTLIRAKLPATAAPPHLREKVLSSVARDRQKRSAGTLGTPAGLRRHMMADRLRRRTLVLGAAVIVSLIFFLSLPWRQHDAERADSVLNTLIQDHLASKLKEHPLDVETSDGAELERWFAPRVDFNVAVPRLGNSNLIGGHLCMIGGKRSVSLSFQKDNIPLTMYMIDSGVIDLATLKVIASRKNKPVFHYDAKGCNLVLWEQQGLVYAIVSDLSEGDLLSLLSQSS